MPDATNTTAPADEDRLSAAVVRIRQNIVDAYKFRPSDAALQPAFDKFMDDMLQTLIETTTAAAVDKATIIVTKDLSAQRQQFQLESQRLREQADIDFRTAGATLLPTLLKMGGGP